VKSGEHLSRVNEAKAEVEEPATSEDDDEGAKGQDESTVTKSSSPKNCASQLQLRRAGSHNHVETGGESPFRFVVNKGDIRSRLQQDVTVTVDKEVEDEDEVEAQLSKLKNIFKEPRTVIQDMIDMSLQKKKLVTSEKMLRKAFIEFYRGLHLLKSYRYGLIRVCGSLGLS